jgi:negative regulator of flagellin synthesis FlgM
MNNTIDTRSPFFPNSKTGKKEIEQAKQAQMLKRNSYERAQELNDIAQRDAKVTIPDTIKDFSRIKRVADSTTDVDNSAKIANLKAQIQAGTYQPDYDAIADKMLSTEF